MCKLCVIHYAVEVEPAVEGHLLVTLRGGSVPRAYAVTHAEAVKAAFALLTHVFRSLLKRTA